MSIFLFDISFYINVGIETVEYERTTIGSVKVERTFKESHNEKEMTKERSDQYES